MVTFIFIFIIAWTGFYYAGKKDNIALMHSVPSVLITIGILGTFTGIGIGLYDFNPLSKDLTRAISPVIEGIQSSVWVSAFGILSSVLFKILVIQPLEEHQKDENNIPQLLKDITNAVNKSSTQYNDSLKILLKEHSDQLENTTKNIVENLLKQTVTQLTRISEEKIENLLTQLSNTSTQEIKNIATTSENSVKNLIQTLSDTSTQSIQSLTEQLFNKFEDPIKNLIHVTSNLKSLEDAMLTRLNDSTASLTTLANNYEKLYIYNEQLLNTMPEVFKKNADSIQSTADSIDKIAKSSDHFTQNAIHLDSILVQFPNLIQDLATRIQEIHEVKTLILQNTGDLSSMSTKLQQITLEIDRFNKESIAHTQQNLQELIQNISVKNNALINDQVEQSLQEMKTSVDDLNNKFLENFESLGSSMNHLSNGFLESFKIFIEKTNTLIEMTQTINVDKLQNEFHQK